MKRIFLLSLLALLLLSGCGEKAVDASANTPEPTEIVPKAIDLTSAESLTREDLRDVSDWEWKEEYGYFVVNNGRHDYLTVWYDPFELSYSLDHPHSSLSDEHIKNDTQVFPINNLYVNENGNTFIPFIFTDLDHPEYEADGDGVFWLLYENFNGQKFLEYYPKD